MMRTLSRSLVLPAMCALVACGSVERNAEAVQLTQGLSFVPIAREGRLYEAKPSAALGWNGSGESFYVALSRRELTQKWFMSAYIKQYFPGGPAGGAAFSLGVRVVSFKVQNDKLYVFDASNNFKESDVFDPTLVLEAYPIIHDYSPFELMPNASAYILIDPAGGQNRFGALADVFAQNPSTAVPFAIELAYLQRFRQLNDGASWEEVFMGTASAPISDAPGANVFKASGTLSYSFRRYAEGPGFTPTPTPTTPFYFLSQPRLVPNQGEYAQSPNKWNIRRGMKPIRWLISQEIVEAQKKWPQYDLIGAVKRGVTNWNEVFGFQALEVEVGTPDDSYADDEKNVIVYDTDQSLGFAFANWRENPNTGEIRGASVYFNDLWVAIADSEFSDAPENSGGVAKAKGLMPPPQRARGIHPKVPGLVWDAMDQRPRCVLWAQSARSPAAQQEPGLALDAAAKKDLVERVVTHVVLHEVGHTLGLRHNFKGSLMPPSSSVMDYIVDDDAVKGLDHPAAYDRDAVRYLYQLDANLPAQPFCTDEETVSDPSCARYDFGRRPLSDYFAAGYRGAASVWLDYAYWSDALEDYWVNGIARYLRAGTSAESLEAWKDFIAPIAVPVDPQRLADDPMYGGRVDRFTKYVFSRLSLDPADARGDFTEDPSDAALVPLIADEARRILINEDLVRSFPTRRVMIAVLKKAQASSALDALVSARVDLERAASTLSGSELNETRELLKRIDAATSPYFVW